MTDSPSLERGYRRILACYPRAFRHESEEEILAVLLATAQPGQQRVGPAEAADLIRGALRMHRGPRLPRPLLTAVRMTYAGAAVELGVLVTLLVTLTALTSAGLRGYPDFSVAQWHGALLARPAVSAAGAAVLLGLWLWMACANARGHHAARIAFRVVHLVITAGVVAEALPGIGTYGVAAGIASGVMIQLQMASLWLIFYPRQAPLPYRPHRQLDPTQR
jgi:hypothetical protein